MCFIDCTYQIKNHLVIWFPGIVLQTILDIAFNPLKLSVKFMKQELYFLKGNSSSNINKIPLFIVCLDAEMVFDKVEWSWATYTMKTCSWPSINIQSKYNLS